MIEIPEMTKKDFQKSFDSMTILMGSWTKDELIAQIVRMNHNIAWHVETAESLEMEIANLPTFPEDR